MWYYTHVVGLRVPLSLEHYLFPFIIIGGARQGAQPCKVTTMVVQRCLEARKRKKAL
jgi:hypothetical protein